MISRLEHATAGKITGMILEMNIADVLKFVDPPELLQTEVDKLWRILLAAVFAERRDPTLGEKIYPMIARLEPAKAGKVTGMILEMTDAEILELLEFPDRLEAEVEKARRTALAQSFQCWHFAIGVAIGTLSVLVGRYFSRLQRPTAP